MKFCSKCGKELADEVQFCTNCGNKAGGDGNVVIQLPKIDFISKSKEFVRKIGHRKLITYTSVATAVSSVLIRVFNSELQTVIHGIALDDYYVISEFGRNAIFAILIADLIVSFLLFKDSKKNKVTISKKQIIGSIVLFLVAVISVVLKVPAPY